MLKKVCCLVFVLCGLAACKGPATTDHGTDSWLNGKGISGELAPGVEDTVWFAYDSSSISPEAAATLKKQAHWWASTEDKPALVVEGHCDDRGTREYNLALGERRAHAAKKYLISHGVARNKIETISYGKEKPVALGSDESAYSKNRRAVSVKAQ